MPITQPELDKALQSIKAPWLRAHLEEVMDVKALVAGGWRIDEVRADGIALACSLRELTLIISGSTDWGNHWLHLSVAHPRFLPCYADLKYAKSLLLGPELEAYQLFVPDARHVNLHPNCLHLWACLEGPALPDFTGGGDSI